MGGAAPRPAAGGQGQPGTPGAESTYYTNLLDRQKQQVANVPAVQEAQNRSAQTPNRPAPNLPGFGGKQQGQLGPEQSRYQAAYDAYIQRFGQGGQQPPQPVQQQPPGAPQDNAFGSNQQRPATPRGPRRAGIRMGGGYASRD